jgi:hypothetical protein
MKEKRKRTDKEKRMALGTILPTQKSLAIDNAYAIKTNQEKERIGKNIKGTKKNVGGEVRYYTSKNKYSIVSNNLKVLRFEVRSDGDYPIK